MSRATRTFLVGFIGVMLLIPVFAFARIDDTSSGLRAAGGAAGLSNFCSTSASSCIATIVGRVINVALGFLGIVLLGYFLYGGFLWMTSGGDSKQAGEAKQIFLNAVIGTFIIGSSFAISSFVLTQLGNVVTGSGGTVTASSDPSSNGATLGTEGGPASCCYTTVEDCRAACAVTPGAFDITGDVTETACRTACSDTTRRYLCSARPTGTPTCSAPERAEDAGLYGSALDACNRFRCFRGTDLPPGTPAPACGPSGPPTCDTVRSCPAGVRSLDDLFARWGRSLPSRPTAREDCRRCITNLISSSAVQTAYAGLDLTCVPALTNAWSASCASDCGPPATSL